MRRSFFQRLICLWHHCRFPFSATHYKPFPSLSGLTWLGDFCCYLTDAFWLGEIWMQVMYWIKPGHVPLSSHQMALARSVFGDAIDLHRVRIDRHSILARHRSVAAFVSFQIINYRHHMDDAVLIHELVHVWQYQRFGSIYMALAWRAHRSESVYDYGGTEALVSAMWTGQRLIDFTVEQQAEIIEDYFKLTQASRSTSPLAMQAYQYFVRQLSDF